MKIKKIYEETDKIGKHKVIEQANGVKIRLLKEPSQWYKDKQAAKGVEHAIKEAARQKEELKQQTIDDRMKEIAIQQLKDEGILDSNGDLIE